MWCTRKAMEEWNRTEPEKRGDVDSEDAGYDN